jgi:stress-induced morphogen
MDNMVLVEQLIKNKIPDAHVIVSDLTGTSDHLNIQVTSKAFIGKPLIEQHRMIMDILKESLKGPVHALKIKTIIPSST